MLLCPAQMTAGGNEAGAQRRTMAQAMLQATLGAEGGRTAIDGRNVRPRLTITGTDDDDRVLVGEEESLQVQVLALPHCTNRALRKGKYEHELDSGLRENELTQKFVKIMGGKDLVHPEPDTVMDCAHVVQRASKEVNVQVCPISYIL